MRNRNSDKYNEPINAPILNFCKLMGKRSSPVKIYIPKKLNSKGKLVPTIEKGKRWYVYCYFRNPKTGKMDYKFRAYYGINNFKTVRDRTACAKNLKKAVEILIDDGFTPFEKFIEPENELYALPYTTVEKAIKNALKVKKKHWSENTAGTMSSHINIFIDYLNNNNLNEIDINELRKKHVAAFLNSLNVSAKSRNNYRASLSSIFAQLVADDLIELNIVSAIPILKVKPNKNKAYTNAQINKIRDYLLKNNPYLLKYLQFVTYAFLRPIEVNRLKVGDIDIKNGRISVKTKTSKHESILIISKLQETINTMNIEKYPKDYFLFTKDQKPNVWITQWEKQRQEWFMKQFRKVKIHFHLGSEYSIYSFRHSFALNLYNKFISDGLTDLQAKHKLMTITRHKSLSGLSNYLRDIGAFVPEDYSDDYTIDF